MSIRINKKVVESYYGDEKKLIIPEGVKKIKESACSSGSMEIVVLPEGIEFIGSRAFFGQKNLREINLPNSITKIKNEAFWGCKSLKNIVWPENCKIIETGTFESCDGIEKVVIPYGVEEIGKQAFKRCKSLKEITIPGSVKRIREEAFFYCENLQQVIIEDGVEEICKDAFFGCESLKEVTIPGSVKKVGIEAFYGCSDLQQVIIDEGVEEISKEAFNCCGSNNRIYLPDSISKLGSEFCYWSDVVVANEESFAYKTAKRRKLKCETPDEHYTMNEDVDDNTLDLESSEDNGRADMFLNFMRMMGVDVSCGDSMVDISDDEMIVKGSTLVKYSGKDGNIRIPKGIKIIGEEAFSENKKISHIIVPEGVEVIGKSAFTLCYGITDIELPSSLRVIDDYAFSYDYIKDINLPEGLEEIGSCAFANCRMMKEIRIPKTVEYIGEYAFGDMGVPLIGDRNLGGTVILPSHLKGVIDEDSIKGGRDSITIKYYESDHIMSEKGRQRKRIGEESEINEVTFCDLTVEGLLNELRGMGDSEIIEFTKGQAAIICNFIYENTNDSDILGMCIATLAYLTKAACEADGVIKAKEKKLAEDVLSCLFNDEIKEMIINLINDEEEDVKPMISDIAKLMTEIEEGFSCALAMASYMICFFAIDGVIDEIETKTIYDIFRDVFDPVGITFTIR